MNRLFLRTFFLLLGAGFVSSATAESSWPREILANDYRIVVYQPQPESLTANKMTARAAVSVSQGDGEPVFGAVWFEARLHTNTDDRTATINDITVPNVHFANASDDDKDRLSAFLEKEAETWEITISMDELSATLRDANVDTRETVALQNDAPHIIVRNTPAVLVTLDGAAEYREIGEDGVEVIVNTPSLLARYKGEHYFLLDGTWLRSRTIDGRYALTTPPPAVTKQLEQATTEGDQESTPITDAAAVPEVIVVTEPAELLVFDGQPNMTPLPGNALLYISNTESDILLEISDQLYYVLLAGRWYSSSSINGEWAYVPADELPDSFQNIPPESDAGDVRAFVAGTDEAKDAVMDAYIPQTASVKLDSPPPEVQYDGEPQFKPIEDTDMQYAVNTGQQIIFADGRYWLCEDAIWYEAPAATGPWTVATSIPQEIYSIPPSNPNYNVTHVHVYESTPSTVYVGYYPGYMGSYVYGPTLVWGTGWYYPGWYGPYYWYPRPRTYGFHVTYNPWTGWNFGIHGGYGRFHWSIGTGGWTVGGGWWGAGGFWGGPRPYGGGVNVNINNINIDRSRNIYNRPANRDRVAELPRTANRRDVSRPANLDNNVFAGRDGSVYRRDNNTWQRRDGSGWSNMPSQRPATGNRPSTQPSTRPSTRPATGAQRPTTRPSHDWQSHSQSLNRQFQSRQHGAMRSQQFHSRARMGGGRRR